MKNKKEWKRVCVCMSAEEYDDLRLLGSLRKESASKFIRYLLNIHIQGNKPLTELMRQLKVTTAKSS